MEVKKKLFAEKIVPHLADGAILTTNTSGLSVNEIAEVLPEDVRRNFLVTHFFNPPRYMRLLEVVASKYTDPDIVSFVADFISRRLGKGIVYGKDTPNFIANRIGVYALFNAMKHMVDMGLTVEDVDAVAGPATARPKSAVFLLADLIGNDTLVDVGNNSYRLLGNDEERDIFVIPEFLNAMVKKGLLGNKTKGGFFKKGKLGGKEETYYYDYHSGDYQPAIFPQFESIHAIRMISDPAKRLKAMVSGNDKAAEFTWRNLRDIIIYSVKRTPEISDDVINVDNAMKWGYSWELGPFEMLDAIGVDYFVTRAESEGIAVPKALKNVVSFYTFDGSKQYVYSLTSGQYCEVPVKEDHIRLDILKRSERVVESNPDASILDLGPLSIGKESKHGF